MYYEPADIEIYIQGKGKVLAEKSLIAYVIQTNKILAIGNEAESYTKQAFQDIDVMSPLKQGMIADFNAAVVMFTHLLQKALGKKLLFKPSVAVCADKGMSDTEKRALEDVLVQAGAKHVLLSELPRREFLRAADSKAFSKYKTLLVITKYDAQRFIMESLYDVLDYAKQEGISAARVKELLTEISEND